MHQHDLSEPLISIRSTPYEQHAAHARVKRTAEYQLSIAATAADKRYWQHCIDRADNQMIRWQYQIEQEARHDHNA